jgi:hypothetical protein
MRPTTPKRVFARFNTRSFATILIFITGVFVLALPFGILRTQASGTISGKVFQDFNSNGAYDTAATINNSSGTGTVGVAVDVGVAGVEVRAYDSAGNNVTTGGAATSDAAGNYSLSATGTGPYRIEFTNLPAGYKPSARSTDSVLGGSATNAGTTVQFLNDGSTPNVNLALDRPEEYCQNNPDLVTSRFLYGDQITGVNNAGTVLMSFPYSAGSSDAAAGATEAAYDNPAAHTLALQAQTVGSTFGSAYARSTRRVYAAAYFKRHAGFGPGGPGAIYNINRTGSGSVSSTITVAGAATNSHNSANWTRDNEQTGWNAVGKTSLGGMAISDDDSTLYVMNLQNRTLYAINAVTGAEIANQAVPLSPPVPAGGNCAAADVRPFAVNYYRGRVYVGMICSAESTATVDTYTDSNSSGSYNQAEYFVDTDNDGVHDATEPFYDADNDNTYDAGEPFVDNDGNKTYNLGDARRLVAYVYSVDPSTLAFDAAPAFSMPLNYKRGLNTRTLGAEGIWRPWSATFRTASTAPDRPVYAQPMLTGIAFDRGNLIIALRDRMGDEVGNSTQSNPTDATAALYQPRTSGDLLRACGSVSGGWIPESNGRCGGNGTAQQNTDEGPGRGEYYSGDAYTLSYTFADPASPAPTPITGKGSNHDELGSGGVAQMPGAPDVTTVMFDPIPNIANMTHDGGVRWMNNTTGAFTKGYRLYDGVGSDPDVFAKANGIGDLELLCDLAPIEIGNRVWLDTNANGVQDAGEAGISGVTVHLFNAANTQIGAAVTDANGEYYFVSSTAVDPTPTDNIGQINGNITPATNYQVRFDLAANYAGGGPLNNRFLTAVNSGFQNGDDDANDSDAQNVANPTGSPAGTFPIIALTTGSAGSNDHTFDVGFAASGTYSLGNRVWFDTDNDGRIDAGEAGLDGVSVSLFADANADGAPDSPGSPLGSATTAGGGYYRFDSLAAGNYVVRINSSNFDNSGDVLFGYQNTTGNVTADMDSTAIASGENGIDISGAANSIQTNGILSNSITLGAGVSEPVGESDLSASGQGAADGLADMTVDFGFYRLCVGNVVFNDMGAGANRDNGIFDSGEIGRANVRIRLYNSTGTEIPVGADGILGTADDGANGMLTNASGNYQFCGLAPGSYRGAIFATGPVSSTPTDATPNNNEDSDDNGGPTGSAIGSIPAGTIVSSAITLTPGAAGALNNNTVSNASGATTDPTLDFGLVVPPSAVTMSEFRADEIGGGVGLSWQSGFEVNNLGYRVWRDTGSGRQLINKELIAGSALQVGGAAMTAGKEYRVLDGAIKSAEAGSASYWLEAIDLDGSSEWFGPVTADGGGSRVEAFGESAPTFAELNSNNAPVQREKLETVGAAADPSASANANAGDSHALKLKVSRDGWYRVSAAELSAYGFNAPQSGSWQLFADGQEQAVLVDGDGSLEFYGRGLNTPESDTRVYWLVNGHSAGRRIKHQKFGFDENAPEGFTRLAVERADRAVRASAILNGERENWYSAIISGQESFSNLSLSEIAAESGDTARLSVDVQGLSMAAHRVAVTLNGIEVGQIEVNSMERTEWRMDIATDQLLDGENRIGLRSLNGSGDVSLLEAAGISYPRRLKAAEDRLQLRQEAGRSLKLTGFGSDQVRIYDTTDPAHVSMFTAVSKAENDGTYSVTVPASANARELLALGARQEPLAVNSIERNQASDWRNAANRADFVIIAPAAFHQQLAALQAKREGEGLRTVMVDIEDVYDEFGYGAHSAQAVRDFLRYAKGNWAVKPGYVLLAGDASSDPRNYSGQGGSQADLVPTGWVDTDTMEASSDEILVDSDGDGVGEMSIGRLPVRTQEDLAAVLAKILAANALKPSGANNRGILTVADANLGYDFVRGNQNIRQALPAEMSVTAINREDGEAAAVRQQIIDRINAGPLMVNFFGHGSTGVWTSGGIFRLDDAAGLTNEQRPSLMVMLTCLNGAFADQNETMSEALLKTRHGGAFAAWSLSSMNYADVQEAMGTVWYQALMRGGRLGDAARAAKASYDHRDTRYTLVLLGDPTQRIVVAQDR